MKKEIKRFKLNYTELADSICEDGEKLPLHCMLDIYRKIGLYDEWKKFLSDHDLKSADPKDYLFCNFATIKTMKGMIENNWSTFNIDILDNDHVIWKPNDLHSRRKRGKKVRAKIRNSINYDFNYYCPALDDEIDDDVIVLMVDDEKILDK